MCPGFTGSVRAHACMGPKIRILTVVCHLATKIDPTLLQLQKKLRGILQKLLICALTWAIQFSKSSFHPRDMFQSPPGRARTRQNHGKSPDSAKIGREIPGPLFFSGPYFVSAAILPPKATHILKALFKGSKNMYHLPPPPPSGATFWRYGAPKSETPSVP